MFNENDQVCKMLVLAELSFSFLHFIIVSSIFLLFWLNHIFLRGQPKIFSLLLLDQFNASCMFSGNDQVCKMMVLAKLFFSFLHFIIVSSIFLLFWQNCLVLRGQPKIFSLLLLNQFNASCMFNGNDQVCKMMVLAKLSFSFLQFVTVSSIFLLFWQNYLVLRGQSKIFFFLNHCTALNISCMFNGNDQVCKIDGHGKVFLIFPLFQHCSKHFFGWQNNLVLRGQTKIFSFWIKVQPSIASLYSYYSRGKS